MMPDTALRGAVEFTTNHIPEQRLGAKIPDNIKSVILGIKPMTTLENISQNLELVDSEQARRSGNYLINPETTRALIMSNRRTFSDFADDQDPVVYVSGLALNKAADFNSPADEYLLKNRQLGLLLGIPPEAVAQYEAHLKDEKESNYHPMFDDLLKTISKISNNGDVEFLKKFIAEYNNNPTASFELKEQMGEKIWDLFMKYLPPKSDQERKILLDYLKSKRYSVAGITWVQYYDTDELKAARQALQAKWEEPGH